MTSTVRWAEARRALALRAGPSRIRSSPEWHRQALAARASGSSNSGFAADITAENESKKSGA